jgi:hypothetical protein
MSESPHYTEVVAELAALIRERPGPDHAEDRARAILRHLHFRRRVLDLPQYVGMSTLMELADSMRARLAYDQQRGIQVDRHGQWMRLGWDVGHLAGSLLAHPSEAVQKVFYAPVWRPTGVELDWFRAGFNWQRSGKSRPVDMG